MVIAILNLTRGNGQGHELGASPASGWFSLPAVALAPSPPEAAMLQVQRALAAFTIFVTVTATASAQRTAPPRAGATGSAGVAMPAPLVYESLGYMGDTRVSGYRVMRG